MRALSGAALGLAFVLVTAACKTGAKTSRAPGTPDVPSGAGASAEEADLRDGGLARAPRLGAVRFELDSYTLSPEALGRLRGHAELLRRHPEWETLVEGHCDDQGSDGYNLALGQRRAKAVRDHLVISGVPANRLATISYGEEAPLCREEAEPCRARNRRAELRVKTAVAGRAAPAPPR